MALLAWGSLMGEPSWNPPRWLGWDKFQHAAAYGILAGLGGLACRGLWPDPRKGWRLGAATAFSVGVILELAQLLLTSTRRAEGLDLVADGTGILLVCWIVCRLESPPRKVRRQNQPDQKLP